MIMIYTVADLDYIYVRVGPKDKTLKEMSSKEFVSWAEEHFSTKIQDDDSALNTPWTPQDKIDFLNDRSKKLGHPAVVMIKRERRDEWDKSNKSE
jgi:hypothetical protein